MFRKIIQVVLAALPLVSAAQTESGDSLSIEERFTRLQFQIDSLKKASANQVSMADKMNQLPYIDSLKAKIVKSEKEIMTIRHNLYNVNRQVHVSNVITVSGAVMTVLGYIIVTQSYNRVAPYYYGYSEPTHTIGIVTSLSGAFMAGVIGPIVRLDANKYLRLAGKKYKVVPKR